MPYDVVIVGGGPAGLSSALALGRARKRALLCDSGPRRNAAAERIHNFVTRDGTPPEEFRRLAREQLSPYPGVEVRDTGVQAITGARGQFRVALGSAEAIEARRVLLCTGMVDEALAIEGLAELWGRSVFQCPYCHGWEAQGRRWGYLARAAEASHLLPFALQLRGWTDDVVVFTGGAFDVPEDALGALAAARIHLERGPVARLLGRERLEGVELSGGAVVPLEVLFAHPPQRQVELVRALGLALDEGGYVQVDPMTRETSVSGVYAAGDLTTRMQAAVIAAAAGTQAAAMLNLDLCRELGARPAP